MDLDVAVVGTELVKSVNVRDIAAAGYIELLLEEHDVVGQPVHCSDLIKPRTLEAPGLGVDIVINRNKVAAASRPLVVEQLGVCPKSMVQSSMAAEPLVAEQIHASLQARAV